MIGKTVSHYKIIEKLGGGGMGIVYKAQDLKLNRFVALKFLPPHLTTREEEKQRFIHEAKAASAFQHHNICTIHEIDETDDGQLFICMDLYEGETLREKIKRNPLKIDEAVDIAQQILQGLKKAHQKGIIHRDIKPANIFITEDGVAKILDFGLAKLSGQTQLTRTGTTIGTVAYMSPEQSTGDDVDHRTDIWSLGVILYEMITGKLPFKGDYEQAMVYSIIHSEPQSLIDNSDTDPELHQIVYRILMKDPNSRYSSAEDLLRDLIAYKKKKTGAAAGTSVPGSPIRFLRKPRFALPVILAIILISVFLLWLFHRKAKIKWAEEKALYEIEQLRDEMNWIGAYKVLKEAEKYISGEPKFIEIKSMLATKFTILTDPPGADVYIREYSDINGLWELLGKTPIDSIEMPYRCFYLMKIIKSEYDTVLAVADTYYDTLFRKLFPEGTIPSGMVYVEGYGDELSGDYIKEKNGFFLDRYEVTNKQFKAFIDNGGYRKPEYWKHKFIRDGKTLSWEEAMTEFIDKTGRPGPATWEASDFPDGQDNYPVRGVSWYEAAAYAEFSGESLPTANHWDSGAGICLDHFFYMFGDKIKPISNFNGLGPHPVGKYKGTNLFGAYDMAGNVREWCWNETKKGRIITGGAWNDAYYLYEYWSQLPPFDRSPENGFRCAIYIEKENIPEDAFQLIDLGSGSDYSQEKPVSDEIFRIYKNQFLYDKTELDSRTEEKDDSPVDWILEKVTFNAAYGNERVIAYLFLPKNVNPPFQTLIFFPGSYAFNSEENPVDQKATNWFIDFLLKNGRAVMYPVYKGTFERYDGVINDSAYRTHQYSEWLIIWTKDFRRSIDYLESRADIDTNKIGFYGQSWGGELGGIIPAVENRLKVNILIVGGFGGRAFDEVAQINYVSRIKIPTLMLNGKYDRLFPPETSANPFFDLLGTPEKDKRICFYETGHFVPKSELIKETLNWLDKYFGPPNN